MKRIDGESETFVVTHALRADGFDASEDGTGRGTPLVAVPILEAGARTGVSTDDPRAGAGIGEDGDPMFTLQSGKQHAVAFSCKDHGADAGDVSPTLRSMEYDGSHANGGGQVAVAFTERTRADGRSLEAQEDVAYALTNPGTGGRTHSRQVMTPTIAVRRLTPMECARLQGFPDTWCAISYRGKPAADGPQYKAYGNAMCVPVMRWILQRIQFVHGLG